MEKADILEMTVAYLRATHCRRRSGLDVSSVGGVDRYAAGFRECAVHVGQYLLDAGVNLGAVHERLMSHLDQALQAVVDVDRLPGADAATEKVLWVDGDCDTTGRCSPDTDDDQCESVSGTVADVDVIPWQCVGRATTVSASVQLLTDATTTTSTSTTTSTTCRQPCQPGAEADSPRSADEFPSFPSTATDDCRPALPSDVINATDNDPTVTCDVERDVTPRITCSDNITDDSSDVWRPW